MGPARPRIILVDEDAAVRAALRFRLELEGYAVDAYRSAEEVAVRARAGAYDCLVTDQRLPGIDGLSLLMILRDIGIAMPAVIMTSDPGARLRERAAELGVAIVEKPLLSDELSSTIRSALAGRRYRTASEVAA